MVNPLLLNSLARFNLFCEKKCEHSFLLWVNKTLILSSQSREYHKYVCAINFCGHGFRGFFFAKFGENNFFDKYFREILHSFALFISAKKWAKYGRKFSHFFVKILVSRKCPFVFRDERGGFYGTSILGNIRQSEFSLPRGISSISGI